jgi:hypothetical protein
LYYVPGGSSTFRSVLVRIREDTFRERESIGLEERAERGRPDDIDMEAGPQESSRAGGHGVA